MTEQTNRQRNILGWLIWIILGLILLFTLLFFLLSAENEPRPLKPFRDTATPPTMTVVDSQPILVTFPELNDNPFAFQDKRIRVTGRYTPQPITDCSVYRGPNIHWSLIAGELQLDAIGYEQILLLVPAGASLTVDGIWRHYTGPLGCGSKSPDGSAWYLQVERIVQPNPLFNEDDTFGTQVPADASTATPIGEPVSTPETTAEPDATAIPGQSTFTPTPTGTVRPTITAVPTTDDNQPTTPNANTPIPPTQTPPGQIATPTPTANSDPNATPTPTSTGTIQPTSAATVTATPTTNGIPTSTPGPTQPPPATATPETGYPPGYP